MTDWIYSVRLHVDEQGMATVTLGAQHPATGWKAWDTTSYKTCDFTRSQHRICEELWIAVANLMERYTYEL